MGSALTTRDRARVDQRREHLAIDAGGADRAEALHAAIELGELGFDRVDAAAGVELAAQRVAQVVATSASPIAGPTRRMRPADV